MSRRKQAKPRLWKREEEDDNSESALLNVVYENHSLDGLGKEDLPALDEVTFTAISLPPKTEEPTTDESGDENDLKEDSCTEDNFGSFSHVYQSRNSDVNDDDQFESFIPDDENSFDSDTLGTEGGSSWVSEDQTTSPSSSCTTPNSTTEAPDSELSFTVGVTDGTPHACRFCDKAFPRHSYLKKHEQTHADCMPFRCEYCRRLFKHKRSRDRHIKLHTGDKKYKCSQCDAAFSRSDHLKIHMKTHDNQKPFQCTVCNRGYNTAAALTSHMQNHKRSSENSANAAPPGTTFKCLQCAEIFRKPEELQKHMNTHQQPSDNPPALNNSRTKTSSYPAIHKSIVNGDPLREMMTIRHKSPPQTPASLPNPLNSSPSLHINQTFTSLPHYFCKLCTMRFSSSQTLQEHKTTVHGSFSSTYNNFKYLTMPESINNGKLYYCVHCAINFVTPDSLAQHFVIFHSPYHLHLLGLTPPEQMKPTDLPEQMKPTDLPEQIKPTDLSVARKPSPAKRSIGEEQTSQKKKNRMNENVSSTPTTSNNQQNSPIQYFCNQCTAAFTDFESFGTHMKQQHIGQTARGLLGGATPPECKRTPVEFTCPHCRSVFSSSEEISQHVIAHFLSTSTAYNCDSCHTPFDRADELQKHLMEIHAHHLYSCSICHEVFDSKVTIQVHFATRHSKEAKVYRCAGCPTSNNIYHTELEFATHVKAIHTNNSSSLTNTFTTHHSTQVVRCFICEMSFPTELDRQLHLATHWKQFQCTLCPQSFPIEYLLDKHMQVHHSASQLNGNQDHENVNIKELSPSQSPGSHFENSIKKADNGESKGNFICCDICEKNEFPNEMELQAHKKLQHHKLLSPGKFMNENSEFVGVDDRVKSSQKQKTNSTMSSPTVRYDGSKKSDIYSGDSGSNNNMNNCEICEKRDFANETELQSHKKLIHHVKLSLPGKVSLRCGYCNESCKSRSDLENHKKSHSQNSSSSGKHKCIICDEMCPTAEVLAEHKLTHCKVLAGKTCMQCKDSITTEEQFYSHIQQHSSLNCSTTTNNNNNNKTSTNNHNNNVSSTQLIFPTDCVICRQTLRSEMEARMHARFHLHQSADLVPCSVCSKMSDRQDLIAGICRECYERHGKSSPFQCPECHMKFDTGTAIERHLATAHRKNYQCQVSFDNKKELQHHVATHLMIDGLNGHECRLCSLVLPTSLQLQAHLIEHAFAGCPTFTCSLCSSVFTTAQGLLTHIPEHGLSARPYDCPRCKMKFSFISELEHHKYVHLEELGMSEGQSYFYNQDKTIHKEKSSTPYLNHSPNLSKYNCSESGIEFRHTNDLYEHSSRFHDRYSSNGDHKRYTTNGVDTASATTEDASNKYEEQNGQAVEVKIECKAQTDCESDDEQIDVVTTKVEDVPIEQMVKNE